MITPAKLEHDGLHCLRYEDAACLKGPLRFS